MAKNKNRKGCLKNGLLALAVVVAVLLITTMILLNLSKENTFDNRLIQVLNREYSTQFIDKIDNTKINSFNTKINTCVQKQNGDSLIINNSLDLEKFFSDNIILKSTLSLNNFDIAVLTNYIFGSLSSQNVNDLLKIFNLEISATSENVLEYVATLQLNLINFCNLVKYNSKNLPEIIYITLSATCDLTQNPSKTIIGASVQINRLIGEDNTYAVTQILKMMNKDTQYIYTIANKPFNVLREIIENFNCKFKVENNCFVFEKK